MRRTSSALLYKATSILLQYPDKPVLVCLDDLSAAAASIPQAPARNLVEQFLGWLTTTPSLDAQQHYVHVFDHTRQRALHLTYYRHGDTRARGMALLTLKHTYRAAGYEPPTTELPDYLPLILEFAALVPGPGRRVLLHCRPGLELLRDALHDTGTPYALLLDAIHTQLPTLRRRERHTLRTLACNGPPTEDVGLEPSAPPEFLTGDHP